MTGELVLRLKWAQVSVGGCSLLQRAALSSFNIASLISGANIFSDMHLCKDTKSLGPSCGSQDVLSLQSKADISSLTFGRKYLRLISLNVSNGHCHSFFVSDSVLRAQRVDMSLSHKVCLSYIAIVVCCKASRDLAFLMSRYCLGPWNIVNLVSLLGLSVLVPVYLGLGSLDVRDVHLIANEFGRCDGACFNLGKVINW